MSIMSLDELISIERVEFQTTKERIQETYVVNSLTLSKLFKKVLSEIKLDILPILNIEMLLYVIKSIPFTNEVEGVRFLESLNECMKFQLYGKSREWNCKTIATKIKKLRKLILYDYSIEGSLIIYCDNRIEWDLGTKKKL